VPEGAAQLGAVGRLDAAQRLDRAPCLFERVSIAAAELDFDLMLFVRRVTDELDLVQRQF
jgi:hypothetical protein